MVLSRAVKRGCAKVFNKMYAGISKSLINIYTVIIYGFTLIKNLENTNEKNSFSFNIKYIKHITS